MVVFSKGVCEFDAMRLVQIARIVVDWGARLCLLGVMKRTKRCWGVSRDECLNWIS